MKKPRKQRERMKAADALDFVPDNIGEGAQMMMAAEMSGMDYDEFCMELVAGSESEKE